MSEEHQSHHQHPAPAEPEGGPDRTGVDRVDAVVDSVRDLADRPVDEHVGVYESAHAELRRTLDEAPAAPDADAGS